MYRLQLVVFLLLICAVCAYSVSLKMWFLYDDDFDAIDSLNIVSATPKAISRHLKRSQLLHGHTIEYTVHKGMGCSLNGLKKMMEKFTADVVNDVHVFIGPICTYMCDVTGMISSAYAIPQVCATGSTLLNTYVRLPNT